MHGGNEEGKQQLLTVLLVCSYNIQEKCDMVRQYRT